MIDRAAKILEYGDAWVNSGFLTEEICRDQLETWAEGEDRNTEHYRHGTIKWILDSRLGLYETEFEAYLAIAKQELTTALYASPMIDLLRWSGLTPKQRRKIGASLSEWPTAVAREYDRQYAQSQQNDAPNALTRNGRS